ncbi:hypothetical protein KAR91_73015 [Candidatus Pacearchaeota archaeon]|nr:hypothetical protein [Candidatus Pacearchaeota archaeon]
MNIDWNKQLECDIGKIEILTHNDSLGSVKVAALSDQYDHCIDYWVDYHSGEPVLNITLNHSFNVRNKTTNYEKAMQLAIAKPENDSPLFMTRRGLVDQILESGLLKED